MNARRRAVLPASLLAVMLVGLLVVSTVLTRDTRGRVPAAAAQLVAEHRQYGEERDSELEMVTSDSSRMAEWFAPRLGFPLELPLLAGTDQRLIGGRVSLMVDRPAAHLLYEWRGHRISLIVARIMPRDLLSVRGQRGQRVDGVELRSSVLHGVALVWWVEEDEGRAYAAASRTSLQTVLEFARRCVQSPHTSVPEKPPT